MRYGIKTDDAGCLIAASEGDGVIAGGEVMDMPEGFTLETMRDWRVVDGTAVHEPIAAAMQNEPTQDDRLSALEEAMLGLLIGGDA